MKRFCRARRSAERGAPLFCFIAAAGCILLGAVRGAAAAEIDPDYATGLYVLAIGLSQSCPAWQVNTGAASTLLSLAGVAPEDYDQGGKRNAAFMKTAASVKTRLAQQPQAASCRDAEGMFGPKGALFKRLLKEAAPDRGTR